MSGRNDIPTENPQPNPPSSPHEQMDAENNQENEPHPPSPIEKPPLGTHENLINQIENGKTEIESLIRRLKDSIGTNPKRATLSKSLELIFTHVGLVSEQLNLWHEKREEKKNIIQINYHMRA